MGKNFLISLEDIEISFDGTKVLRGISLNIKDREFVTLLGPSGCGKTTTLRIIGGFANPDRGNVLFDGRRINDLPPYKRSVNTIFQRYALFPHLDVSENVAFGLQISKVTKDEIPRRIKEMLSLVNLNGFEKRHVNSLSGGQQQRVAIARALVNSPRVLLLDEPLGALDLKLRREMQTELKNMQQRLGITFIYVTHDQEEALTMSDTVVVMNDGRILQQGTPQDVYNEPANAFVADFIGESNIVPGIMRDDYNVEFCGRNFICVDKGFGRDEPVEVVIRPEDVKIVTQDAQLFGEVRSVIFKGVHYEMLIKGDDFSFLVHSTLSEPVGAHVGLLIVPNDLHIMHKSKGGDIC
jgi:spermidine/putrescine transport system ATP-binding protein